MDNKTYRSYAQWIQSGRAVQAGEKAAFYALNTRTGAKKAVFAEHQTFPLDAEDYSGEEWIIQTAEEAKGPVDKRDKLKIDYTTETNRVSIWCGSSKKGLNIVKKSGFKFDPNGYRWLAYREPERFESMLTKLLQPGIELDLEVRVDGNLREVVEA